MSAKEQLRSVHDWNKKHAVGCQVNVTLDDGTSKQTTAASEAWLLGGHTAVILLDGISGAYSLHRVSAVAAGKLSQ